MKTQRTLPRSYLALIALCALILSVALMSKAAFANDYPPRNGYPLNLAVYPSQGAPGTTVTITGTQWDPAFLGSGFPIYLCNGKTASDADTTWCSDLNGLSTGSGSPGYQGQQFTVQTKIPSDAPQGRDYFLVMTPVAPASDVPFTVTTAAKRSYANRVTAYPKQGPPGTQVTLVGNGWDPTILAQQLGGYNRSGLPVYFRSNGYHSSLLGFAAASSPSCDPCSFFLRIRVPSDAPRGPGYFDLAPEPLTQWSAAFTVTRRNRLGR